MAIGQETITAFLSGAVIVDDLKIFYISDARNWIVHLTFAHDGYLKARKMIVSRHSNVVFREDEGLANLVEQAVGRYLAGSAQICTYRPGRCFPDMPPIFKKKSLAANQPDWLWQHQDLW